MKTDDYVGGSIGRISGTRSAWESVLSRGGCDSFQGPLHWTEHFFFLGSEKGPHSQISGLAPPGYPAMYRWHHGSPTPLDIACGRGYLEESSNVLLVTGSAMTPWHRSRSYAANPSGHTGLISWQADRAEPAVTLGRLPGPKRRSSSLMSKCVSPSWRSQSNTWLAASLMHSFAHKLNIMRQVVLSSQ